MGCVASFYQKGSYATNEAPDEKSSHGKRRDNDDPFPPSRSLATVQTSGSSSSSQKSEEEPKPAKTEPAPPPLIESVTEIQSSKEESIPETSQSANETEDKQPLEIKPERPPSRIEEEPVQQSQREEASPEVPGAPFDIQEDLDIEAEGSQNERDPEVVDHAVVKIQAGIRGYLTRKALKENPPVTRPSNSPRKAAETAVDDGDVEEIDATPEQDEEEILVISEPQKPEELVVVPPPEEPIKTEIISRVSTEIPEVAKKEESNLNTVAGNQEPIVLPVSKIEKELVDLLADAAAAGPAESAPREAPPRPAPPATTQATTDHAPTVTATPISVPADVEKKETPRVPVVQNEEEYEEEYTDEEYEEEEEEEEEEAVSTQPAPISVNHVGGQETPRETQAVSPNAPVAAVTREVRPQWVTSSVYDTVQGNQDEEEYEEEEEEEKENGTATPPVRTPAQPTTPPAPTTTPPAPSTTPPAQPNTPQQSQQASTEPRPAPLSIKDAKE